jgi:hypothetical protein
MPTVDIAQDIATPATGNTSAGVRGGTVFGGRPRP